MKFLKLSQTSTKALVVPFMVLFAGCGESGKETRSPVSPVQEITESEKAEQKKEASNKIQKSTAETSEQIAKLNAELGLVQETSPETALALQKKIDALEMKLIKKRTRLALPNVNRDIMAGVMKGHTNIYPFKGKYSVLVIPVQFSDVKFEKPDFYLKKNGGTSPAQDYLFGEGENSLTTNYLHASMGKLTLSGQVLEPVTVDNTLEFYGKAITGRSDQNARRLVVDSLLKIKEQIKDDNWWNQFDQWDLNDYDNDKHFHEPDGFMDAVVLIYAGKSQASCQRSFDPDGQRPGSDDVAEGPRKPATVECFNRIWPHRWAISLSSDDPDYSKNGPKIEGTQLPSLNGLRINEKLFALDYNMQSEFSDISTFAHEFGHSLTLPDIYAYQGENNVGAWTLMASNASYFAQEFDSYSKLSLGWLNPKIIKQGENSGVYVGHQNFVAAERRDGGEDAFYGPTLSEEYVDGSFHAYDILSKTQTGQPVYRSVMAVPTPRVEKIPVTKVAFPENTGKFVAYSDRYDGEQRALKFSIDVPEDSSGKLTFDTLYHIETETNFASKDKEIKVITDYDLGAIKLNNELVEQLRLISGDSDYDTLADLNPACEYERVLELRTKSVDTELSDDETKEFTDKTATCQTPIWLTKEVDVSEFKGKTVTLEISLTTDAGYTEFGILVDNVKLDDYVVDFESSSGSQEAGQFTLVENGKIEKTTSQFYLMEYRTPNQEFKVDGEKLSLNLDTNIKRGAHQSMFISDGETSKDRFRMVEFSYQDGLLVWYFNSAFDRRSNNPQFQEGQGYLLPLNPKVQDVRLPGIFNSDKWVGKDGVYLSDAPELKALVEEQKQEFICFSHTEYATYISGEVPDCSKYSTINEMKSLTKDGSPLVYRRENFNEILPLDRYLNYQVGTAFRSGAALRTGISVFRPESRPYMAPYKVFKAEGTQMVVDERLTATAPTFPSVSSFKDVDNNIHPNKKLLPDTAIVNKVGFEFDVVDPDPRSVEGYRDDVSASAENHTFRRPLVKVNVRWKAIDQSAIEEDSVAIKHSFHESKHSKVSLFDRLQCVNHIH